MKKHIYICLYQISKQKVKPGDASGSKTSPWNGLRAARSNGATHESGSASDIYNSFIPVECRKIFDINADEDVQCHIILYYLWRHLVSLLLFVALLVSLSSAAQEKLYVLSAKASVVQYKAPAQKA